jgi:hypothetical protein
VTLNKFALLPLISTLGNFLQDALAFAIAETAASGFVRVEAVADFLEQKMGSWNPDLSGIKLLDGDTRKAAARFLAGVAYNLATKRS